MTLVAAMTQPGSGKTTGRLLMNPCWDLKLVETGDTLFRAHCRTHRLASGKSAPGEWSARTYQRALHRWETMTRRALGELTGMADNENRRILSYWTQGHQRRNIKAYRELDFVGWQGDRPALIGEIKLRERGGAGDIRGVGQLRSAQQLIHQKWANVPGLVVNVAMGEILGTENTAHLPLLDPPEIRRALQECLPGGLASCWIDGWAVAELGILRGWITHAEVMDLSHLRRQFDNPQMAVARATPLPVIPLIPEWAVQAAGLAGIFATTGPSRLS